MSNEVISTYERVDRVISEFAKQVGEYHSNMMSELHNLELAVRGLGQGWKGEDYDRFVRMINTKVIQIRSELNATEQLKSYLEDVSREFKQYLDQLKEASDD